MKANLDFVGKWKLFSKFKSFIQGTSILPVKAPLSIEMNAHLPQENQFFWPEVLEFAANQGKPIACVMSFANSLKFYEPKDLPQEILFQHHPISFQQRLTRKQLRQIFDKMAEYDSKGQGIVIHCTHGVNRTGYIVCKYLNERKNFTIEEAISLFEDCRGQAIENGYYLNALRNQSSERKSIFINPKNFLLQKEQSVETQATK
mgnify:CR=1 FL=1